MNIKNYVRNIYSCDFQESEVGRCLPNGGRRRTEILVEADDTTYIVHRLDYLRKRRIFSLTFAGTGREKIVR